MKSSLVILAIAVAVVGVAAATSAPSRSAAAPAAKQSCTFATLPRATPAGQQSLYGHITSLTRRGSHYVLRFDPAWLLSGVTASRAALADTGSADVPNDTYTRDETHKLLTFLVPAGAHVTVLTHATCSTKTTMPRTRSRRPFSRWRGRGPRSEIEVPCPVGFMKWPIGSRCGRVSARAGDVLARGRSWRW